MLTLKAKLRNEKGRATQKLRAAGFIPAILYGPGIKNKNIAVEYQEFIKLYHNAGGSSLISLEIEGEKIIL